MPLSASGKKLRDLIRRPITDRPPVGYERDWLFDYKPGKTWYVPKTTRESLHALGKTPDDDRPAGTFARDILGRLLIDLSWASSRLEGNTYTRLDTQNLIEFGQRAAGKDALEAQMILNHKAAIELIASGSETIGFNRQTPVCGSRRTIGEPPGGSERRRSLAGETSKHRGHELHTNGDPSSNRGVL